jgi:rhodanese-related sulfurtransferase
MLKEQVYTQFARIGKSLSSPARIEILDLLAQGEKTVEAIAKQTRLGLKNASAHLRELRAACLVETRKEGTYVFYRLASESVFRLLREFQGLARERIAEIDRVSRLYFDARDELEPVLPHELLRRLGSGEVTLLDVRPQDEYRAGHIPGAISIPPESVNRRIEDLPKDRDVVAYCRGPYCVYAASAVEALRRAGFRARRMEAGVPDWRALGYPVETGISA